LFLALVTKGDLQWNHSWYEFVKKSIDSLSKARMSRPQPHAAVTEEPAARDRRKTRGHRAASTTGAQYV